MKVYVVMGNDYPHSVYADEEAAKKFCREKNAEWEILKGEYNSYRKYESPGIRIYWRVYDFVVQ